MSKKPKDQQASESIEKICEAKDTIYVEMNNMRENGFARQACIEALDVIESLKYMILGCLP